MRLWRQKLESCSHKPRETCNPQQLEEVGRTLPWSHQRELRAVTSFFFFLTSLLEYNCFTLLCWLLLYNEVNQLYVYIYPHIPSLFRLSPMLPITSSRWSQSTELISLCYAAASHQLSILRLVVYIGPCHSLTLSQLTLPPPCILKSILS